VIADDRFVNADANKLERIEALFTKDNAKRRDAPFVTVEQWLAMKDEPGTVLVDVRPHEERRVGMIPGALTREQFEARRAELAQHTIVSYCTIGGRSGAYTEELRAKGLRALNLKGSVLLWAHAGGTFVDEHGRETRRAHVSGAKWDLLPAGYTSVW
jgi:rhodanese-related sulfurtransferase